MPIFAMSVFLLPRATCNAIESTMSNFWWGSGESDRRGIHWLSWARLAKPKHLGGMGFKRMHEFNVALLAKQGWRILTSLNSLVCRVFKAKYFPNGGFLSASLGHNPSYLWRSIVAAQNLLRDGVGRRIGNGRDTFVWGDCWLADVENPKLDTECYEELRYVTVSNLMSNDGLWDQDLLRDLLLPTDVDRVLATPVALDKCDVWYWRNDIRGQYTVKHGYRLLTESSVLTHVPSLVSWHKLWRLKVPPKVRVFLWRCIRGILPVKEVLKEKRVFIGGGCPL
ncbi:PREDICTED: uncharacterized protein LOC109179064 [Ipomoea nil]|uniref:uncharacterized protein LOC109179064 n=1 Tax=Ipomoea nil TaxID=35883 RepID=UPI000900ADBB|nr:PREDICTED: uncharacterized protein LOC109179064 [Ipomoea nil]